MLEKGKQRCHTEVSPHTLNKQSMRHQVYTSEICHTTISESTIAMLMCRAEVILKLHVIFMSISLITHVHGTYNLRLIDSYMYKKWHTMTLITTIF